MSRSQKKGPFVSDKLFRKVERQTEAGSKEPIKTWARSSTVVPEFIGFAVWFVGIVQKNNGFVQKNIVLWPATISILLLQPRYAKFACGS